MAETLGQQMLYSLLKDKKPADKNLAEELMKFDKSVLVAGLLFFPTLNRQIVLDYMWKHKSILETAKKGLKEINNG